MTFTQLRAFALVAELGSLRAAAAALGISEPAVSAAMAALRADVGDRLFVRSGSGIALTSGGRALAAHARELVRLEDRARRDVTRAATAPDRLRVLACSACGEHVARLLDAFTERVPGADVDLSVGTVDIGTALAEGLFDVALGPRPVVRAGQSLETTAFLRYRRVVVSAPGHPLAATSATVSLQTLADHRWATGPAGLATGAEEQHWARQLAAAGGPADVRRLGSETDALAAAREGGWLVLAFLHQVRDDLRRGTLRHVPAEDTPVTGMWWATLPGSGRVPPAARSLQRFLTTPEATAALLARPAPRDRRRPRVRVELWS